MDQMEVCRILNKMISNTVYIRMKKSLINLEINSKAIDKTGDF